MSHRVFTWWRRFHTPVKLPKEMYWQAPSKLLQRIEFGEFEYNQLSEQTLLEEAIFEKECEEIRKELNRSNEDAIQMRIYDRRKLKNKRIHIMMEKHLQYEQELLRDLVRALSDEFGMTNEFVTDYIENFDGDTRQLYYSLLATANNRPVPSLAEIDAIKRFHVPQPRHVLKHEHRKYKSLWREVVNKNKIWNAHNISYKF
jgi:hypothetical protein